jgi:hypothetical protein
MNATMNINFVQNGFAPSIRRNCKRGWIMSAFLCEKEPLGLGQSYYAWF